MRALLSHPSWELLVRRNGRHSTLTARKTSHSKQMARKMSHPNQTQSRRRHGGGRAGSALNPSNAPFYEEVYFSDNPDCPPHFGRLSQAAGLDQGHDLDLFSRLGWLPPEKNRPVLDVGAGCGRAVKLMLSSGHTNITAIERSDNGVAMLQKLSQDAAPGVAIKVHHADLLKSDLQLNQNGYDSVLLLWGVINDFGQEEQKHLLEFCLRWLTADTGVCVWDTAMSGAITNCTKVCDTELHLHELRVAEALFKGYVPPLEQLRQLFRPYGDDIELSECTYRTYTGRKRQALAFRRRDPQLVTFSVPGHRYTRYADDVASQVIQTRGRVLAGISLFNGYYNKPTTRALVSGLLQSGYTVYPFIPWPIAHIATLAQVPTKSVKDAVAKAKRDMEGCVLRAARDFQPAGGELKDFAWGTSTGNNPCFKEGLEQVEQMFNEEKDFREAVIHATQEVLRGPNTEEPRLITDDQVATGCKLLLHELAFLLRVHDIIGLDKQNLIAYLYHQEWPILRRFLGGEFCHRGKQVQPRNVGFWQAVVSPEQSHC